MFSMVEEIERLAGIEVGDLNVRHQAVLDMLHQHYHDPPHAMQVAALGLQLFDQLRSLHGFGQREAELFEFGILLHNVGEHGEDRDHHIRTAALIRDSKLPGFTDDELNAMGVLAAAHTIQHQRELDFQQMLQKMKKN